MECSNAGAGNGCASADARALAWSRYWSSGALHSCVTTYRENYAGTLGGQWITWLESLPHDAHVLDIATGNGALPKLGIELTNRPRLTFDAIDVAALHPGWWERLDAPTRARVRFQGGVTAENLPFADDTFDAVASQFGLEYSSTSRSLPEAVRVLKPGGCWATVLHHEESIVVRNARAELQHAAWIDSAGGLLATVEELVPLFARARTAQGRSELSRDPVAEALRDRFNALQEQLETQASRSGCPDLLHDARRLTGEVLALAGSGDVAGAQGRLGLFRVALSDSRIRLSDLVRCALGTADVRDWRERLGALGMATEVAALHEGPHLMGWWLMGRKATRD